MCSMLTGMNGLPGHWMVLLCWISWGEGILGPTGVDHRLSRSGLPASWVVLRAGFRVLSFHSMKPFDWGKWGEEVVWSICCHCKNCVNSSDAKGGTLLV